MIGDMSTTPASPMVAPASPPSPLDLLRDCLSRVMTGPWRFIQLRGEPLGDPCIDGDDVDLLGSGESVELLMRAAMGWVREGRCHWRTITQKPEKVEWWLISIDGKHTVRFDLWIELSQLDRGRRVLRYEDASPHVVDKGATIQRLSIDVEACVYVHHLVCKRKDLRGESAQRRLEGYATGCRENSQNELAAMLDQMRSEGRITDHDEVFTLTHLAKSLGTSSAGSTRRRTPGTMLSRLRMKWLGVPKHASMVCVMGCDGAGKTTLAGAVKGMLPVESKVHTGKHLYRKSILYKLAVIFIRPLLMRSRESFDEVLAPLVYLRACLALRLRLMFHAKNKLTLVDRSLVDFLYVNRKTDQPRFSRWLWLSRWFGKRISTIHCIVKFENVIKRKQEMTAAGHEAYDRDMFEHLARRVPTDYVAFNNDASIDDAAQALARVLQLGEDGAKPLA